jgi:transcriptional regulator with XRE-family HTH domain
MANRVIPTERPKTEPNNLESIGKMIKYKRTSLGLSKQEVADYCKLNYRTVDGIERGNEYTRVGNLIKVAQMLGIKIEARE